MSSSFPDPLPDESPSPRLGRLTGARAASLAPPQRRGFLGCLGCLGCLGLLVVALLVLLLLATALGVGGGASQPSPSTGAPGRPTSSFPASAPATATEPQWDGTPSASPSARATPSSPASTDVVSSAPEQATASSSPVDVGPESDDESDADTARRGFVAPVDPGTSTTRSAPAPVTSPRAAVPSPRATSKAAPAPAPAPTSDAAPAPAPETAPAQVGGQAYYENCAAVRAAGAAPIRVGDPGYSRKLDRDGDGEGCAGD